VRNLLRLVGSVTFFSLSYTSMALFANIGFQHLNLISPHSTLIVYFVQFFFVVGVIDGFAFYRKELRD